MASIFDVTNYLIQLSHSVGEPEPINPLKIQKLLYYAQGISLAKRDGCLFSDKIKAWRDGPVVPLVWHQYKEFGRNALPCPDAVVSLEIDDRVFLRQVWALYGKYTGDELSKRTHEEAPWKDARRSLMPDAKSDNEISCDALKCFFVAQDIRLPSVPRPVEIRRGREVYSIEDAGKILPVGI